MHNGAMIHAQPCAVDPLPSLACPGRPIFGDFMSLEPPMLHISAGSASRILCPTLRLCGRQGAWGGAAKRHWWPVHSRGLFDGLTLRHRLGKLQVIMRIKKIIRISSSKVTDRLRRNKYDLMFIGPSVSFLKFGACSACLCQAIPSVGGVL